MKLYYVYYIYIYIYDIHKLVLMTNSHKYFANVFIIIKILFSYEESRYS